MVKKEEIINKQKKYKFEVDDGHIEFIAQTIYYDNYVSEFNDTKNLIGQYLQDENYNYRFH